MTATSSLTVAALGIEGLGAIPLNETRLPEVRCTRFADPEGNDFDLVTWQPV